MSPPPEPETGVPRSRLVNFVRIAVAVILGGIGAAVGFTHTHEWALHHGQTGWLAWATAVVIEGMAVVAGFEIQRDHACGRRRKLTFPMAVLVFAVGIQMAAQVALAEPSVPGWIVASMPALAFLVVVKLLMRSTSDPAPEAATAAETAPDAAPTAVAAEPAPDPVPAMSSEVTPALAALKLPPEMTSRVGGLADAARAEGRQLTTSEIRDKTRIPEPMAARILEAITTTSPTSTTA